MSTSHALTASDLQVKLAKGWKPNAYLSNMSMAFFTQAQDYVADSIFPICPVDLSTSSYYIFSRGDLARDNVQRKPLYGKVTPAVFGQTTEQYHCQVDQVIIGLDRIQSLDYSRTSAPGAVDLRRNKVRLAVEQMRLHRDIQFARSFFKPGVWGDERRGVAAAPGAQEFFQFNDANFDPVSYFDQLKREVKQRTRRAPNRLALGYDAYLGLKNHPEILERVKYTGSAPNPAVVNINILAQILGLEKVVVLESTYNSGSLGKEDMQFICDSKSALLCYATDTPQVDEPSAGYTFAWDMLGNGQHMVVDQWEGENGTHSEFVEALTATDMKKTCDDMAVFLTDCV